jgi:hypothetical protein
LNQPDIWIPIEQKPMFVAGSKLLTDFTGTDGGVDMWGRLRPGLNAKAAEDELRQLVAIIENPVNRKFGQMAGEMQISLQRGLAAEIQGTLDPKIKSLELTVAGRLGIPVTAPAAASSARQPAKAASK